MRRILFWSLVTLCVVVLLFRYDGASSDTPRGGGPRAGAGTDVTGSVVWITL